MKPSFQTNFVYMLIFIAILAMVFLNFDQTGNQNVVSINEVAAKIKAGEVSRILEDENSLTIITTDEQELLSTKESGSTLIDQLVQYGVTSDDLQASNVSIEIQEPGAWVNILSIVSYLLPFLIIGASFFFIFRQAQGSKQFRHGFWKITSTHVQW